MQNIRLHSNVRIVCNVGIDPLDGNTPATAVLCVEAVVHRTNSATVAAPDLISFVNQCKTLLTVVVSQSIGSVVEVIDFQRGACVVSGLENHRFSFFGSDPGLDWNVDIPAVTIKTVDGEIAKISTFRHGNAVNPVGCIQRKVKIVLFHIPVVDSFLHGVAVTIEIQAVVDDCVVKDIVFSVCGAQSNGDASALTFQIVVSVLVILPADQHDILRISVGLNQNVIGPCFQCTVGRKTKHFALLLQPSDLGIKHINGYLILRCR